jgi:tRNA(Ile)-lysidine synthase
MSTHRPRLTPAIADVRRAVRNLPFWAQGTNTVSAGAASVVPVAAYPSSADETAALALSCASPLALVALSGGPDSLALAAAVAFEAPRLGWRAGAVIIDHALQKDSAAIAAAAGVVAVELGLNPVIVRRVTVGDTGGPEAAARAARYAALSAVAAETGAMTVLLGHTLDDQAETVLLGLARGSGASSLTGMAEHVGLYARPLLGIRRATTVQACTDAGLTAWIDPHNSLQKYTRVRVRTRVLPVLEEELGPGIAEALARTAEQLREDAEALDRFADELVEELAEIADGGISLPVAALAANPAALRQRLIRLAVASEFHVSLTRGHTLEVARLVTHWHGQSRLDLPGVRVERRGGLIVFTAIEHVGAPANENAPTPERTDDSHEV